VPLKLALGERKRSWTITIDTREGFESKSTFWSCKDFILSPLDSSSFRTAITDNYLMGTRPKQGKDVPRYIRSELSFVDTYPP